MQLLKRSVNQILDHIIRDLGIERIPLKVERDFYWETPSDKLYAVRDNPPQLDVGRLTDDWDFLQKMLEDDGAVALMLIHVAPLLRYVGEEVGE